MRRAKRSTSRPRRRSTRGAQRRGPAQRLRLRRATVADLPVLVRHRRSMWEEIREFPPDELDRHDAIYRRWVRQLMAERKFLALLVEDSSGHAVGSGGLWLMPAQPRPGVLGRGEMPYVLSMYTEPGHRGRGVASRIVREMMRWSAANGFGRIVLHASRFGRSVYERLGFEVGSEMRRELIRRPASRR